MIQALPHELFVQVFRLEGHLVRTGEREVKKKEREERERRSQEESLRNLVGCNTALGSTTGLSIFKAL